MTRVRLPSSASLPSGTPLAEPDAIPVRRWTSWDIPSLTRVDTRAQRFPNSADWRGDRKPSGRSGRPHFENRDGLRGGAASGPFLRLRPQAPRACFSSQARRRAAVSPSITAPLISNADEHFDRHLEQVVKEGGIVMLLNANDVIAGLDPERRRRVEDRAAEHNRGGDDVA